MSQSQISLYHGDCMAAMAKMPDKAYDLAIVDPPYGIGANKMQLGNGKKRINRGAEDWDLEPPKSEYFEQLFRVSKNQVIWGGNYFVQLWGTPCRGFVIWDKGTGDNDFADCELAWTSFDSVAKMHKVSWVGANAKNGIERIHPTEKPIALYKWLLAKYAKAGDRILDTHGGSMSIAIACHDMGFDLDLWEIDKDYYDAGVKRFNAHKAQSKLFTPQEMYAS